ncbi:DUF2945 domain-containing protein [Arthrobacter gengyunqii]|uniref:DUF2945 domain-containing protein n=1 Tax=Arthrobacter gengyunqii TaxID=2886940 RepID=A0ABS8GGL1_9MICC|nr:DUF2945 domain-containing protein [Arthrobacter gengyunqii]MCC3265792.1 DUF2945 domain-containing protein [Arthrobacter gengyunqii]
MTDSPATGPRYAVGDQVRWNFQGSDVLGIVTEIHTADFEFMGRVRVCSEDEPQYKVRSDSSQRHAVHKGAALRPAKD